MAEQSDGAFDEDLLNQPWHPVSYFDEEEHDEDGKSIEASNTSDNGCGKGLAALFETNLHSVKNDLQRINLRRQSQGEELPLEGLNAGPVVHRGREDTDPDTVDTTLLMNKKNINDDIKRFEHFKQNSIDHAFDEFDKMHNEESVSFDSGLLIETSTNMEKLINLMPDAVQELPTNLPVDADQEQKDLTGLGTPELDLDSLLPEVFNGEPATESDGTDSMDIGYGQHCESNTCCDKLIDFESMLDTNEQAHESSAQYYDMPITSEGSSESVNEILRAAEELVNDFGSGQGPTGGLLDRIVADGDQGTMDAGEGRRNCELIDYAKHGNVIEEDKFGSVHVTNTGPLKSDFDADLEMNGELADKSLSSLHDELVDVSPGHDFNEPSFEGSEKESEDNGAGLSEDVDVDVVDLSSLSLPESQVKRKVGDTEKKAKKNKRKGRHSSKPKYIVQVLRQGDVGDADADLSSGSEVSSLQLDSSIGDATEGFAPSSLTPSMDYVEELVIDNINNRLDLKDSMEDIYQCSKELSHDSQLSSENLHDSQSAVACGSESIVQKPTGDLVIANESSNQDDHNNLMHDDIAVLTSQISIQLADEVLNESIDVQNESQTDQEQNLLEQNGETQQTGEDQAEETQTVARTGSTSENEELEEFISQQLDAADLPPLTDLPTPSATDGLTHQAYEDTQLGWYAPKWVPDKDSRSCMNCGVKFTVVRRRHHCRACGKVMCANCCNMRAELPYLEYKPGRVCQACNELLGQAQSLMPVPLMYGNRDVPGRGHTISLNDNESEPSSFIDSPPQYMPESPPEYSVTPGVAAQSGPPNPPSYFASSSSSSSTLSPSSRLSRGRTESDRSVVIMFNSSQTDLPPILRIENEVVKIINNPDLKGLFTEMMDSESTPVAFLVNKNLVVKVKVISFDCCIGKQCWCFSSDGMGASNQEEIIFIVEYKGPDSRLLKCIFQQLNSIFERAKHGDPVSDLGFILFDDFMLNNPANVGMLLFKQTVQCDKNLCIPCHPHLFGVWVQQTEIPWAKNLPLRLLLRLGAEFKHYPCPLFNLQKRDPVYTTLGRTIVDLLADFRNFQYTLPRITGLLISVSKKETIIKLPQSRYDEILKVLNVSEENVLAFCGNFNRKADSHLVCIENDGTYSTQTITCRTSSKKVTGCNFAVFSAGLKKNPENIQIKSSIVEDGIMIQVTAETMKKIRTAIKDMSDLIISPEPKPDDDASSSDVNRFKLVWGSSDDSNTRTKSPIDGSFFDGLTNMRIRHSYDFTVSTSPAKIHWQEVYFLPNDADTVGRLSAKELSQMTSSVAKACMNALSPHLSTLVALDMTKIGLRISLDSDSVEYQIGSNNEQLPQELSGELDDKLIPVIHSVMKTVPHRRVSAELIFQIARIV
eukprot:gene7788-8633_t